MVSPRKKEEQEPVVQSPPVQNPPAPSVVSDSDAEVTYANFCRVTATPEEMIVDFALNPQVSETQADPIHLRNRVVMNYYTAKRLLHALSVSLQRHELAFGPLEVNVQQRIKNYRLAQQLQEQQRLQEQQEQQEQQQQPKRNRA